MSLKQALLSAPNSQTENGALTYSSTGSARLDYFFQVIRGREKNVNQELKKRIVTLLPLCWEESPIHTLKLIFQKRDCRQQGAGAGEKEIFWHSFIWLWNNHKEVARKNFHLIPEYGSWKDLLQLSKLDMSLRQDTIQLFAEQLHRDRDAYDTMLSPHSPDPELNAKAKPINLSLCSKWCPSEGSHFDKGLTDFCKELASEMKIPPRKWQQTLRRVYLSPLRRHLEIVESFMCGKQWNNINFNHVPSVAMKLYRKAFERNSETFTQWMKDLKAGKKDVKINAGQLMPHELVKEYLTKDSDENDVIEQQWKALVNRTRDMGKLSRCLVMSDMSGSMTGVPMEVSAALGLLISEVAQEPFDNLVVTFSENPHFLAINPGWTLKQKVKHLMNNGVGYNTDLNRAFQIILNRAVESKVQPSEMPNRIILISDMEFDSADNSGYSTNYEVIQRQYLQAGYVLPEIVFWNVRGDSTSCPVTMTQQKVALVSGFSPNILRTLCEGDIPDPMSVMLSVLNNPHYDRLQV